MKMNLEEVELKSLSLRNYLIKWLISFADKEWQIKDWCSYGNTSYSAQIENAANFIFDDLRMEKCLENEEIPYDRIGWIFKTKEEAEELFKFCKVFNDFLEDVPQRSPNEYYLNSKLYTPMVKAAQSTTEAFFKNEKDKPEAYSKM